ncbi:hypothetical protein HXT55_05195 [Gardnerella sp. KA00718]|uniref:hypothetical protein n=1 Tax=Gardnerella sp. KA00718 TaxID=2749077 RepID=UPI003BAC5075
MPNIAELITLVLTFIAVSLTFWQICRTEWSRPQNALRLHDVKGLNSYYQHADGSMWRDITFCVSSCGDAPILNVSVHCPESCRKFVQSDSQNKIEYLHYDSKSLFCHFCAPRDALVEFRVQGLRNSLVGVHPVAYGWRIVFEPDSHPRVDWWVWYKTAYARVLVYNSLCLLHKLFRKKARTHRWLEPCAHYVESCSQRRLALGKYIVSREPYWKSAILDEYVANEKKSQTKEYRH